MFTEAANGNHGVPDTYLKHLFLDEEQTTPLLLLRSSPDHVLRLQPQGRLRLFYQA